MPFTSIALLVIWTFVSIGTAGLVARYVDPAWVWWWLGALALGHALVTVQLALALASHLTAWVFVHGTRLSQAAEDRDGYM